METLKAAWQLTDTNLEEGTFRGIASVFGSMVDAMVPTIIERGAFVKSIQERGGGGRGIKILYQHEDPIGVPLALAETEVGLEVTAKISQTALGKDVLTLMRDGVIDQLSIGFDPLKWEMDEHQREPIRHLKEVRLWEISLVTFAADPQAKVLSVHRRAPYIDHEQREPYETQAVVSFQDLPLADRDRAWDATQAERRVRDWAGASEQPNSKYKRAFLWWDTSIPDQFGAYKLPIADVINGSLTAIPRGIFAAAGVLRGARGGVAVPEGDKPKLRAHVSRYYAKMRQKFGDEGIMPPWEKDSLSLAYLHDYDKSLWPSFVGQQLLTLSGAAHEVDLVQSAIGILTCAYQPEPQPVPTTALAAIDRQLREAELAFAETSFRGG